MERSRIQLELDWQRRYEEKESNQYEKSEDLIKKLAKSRDEVISESRIKLVEFCCPAWSFMCTCISNGFVPVFMVRGHAITYQTSFFLIHQFVTCYFTQNIDNGLYIEDYISFVYVRLNLYSKCKKKKKPPKILKLNLLSLKVQSFTSIHVLQIMMTKTINHCYMV